MRHEKLPQILSELRERFVEHYGDRLVKVVLFGSQARGDAVPGSDIDVMVVLKGDVHPSEELEQTGDLVAALSLQYDVLLSTVFRPEEAFYQAETPLLINVRREGVPV
ncbi:MAG: nucleotidyltransferase domain-containing protein [Blastocatellia bacterium]